MRMAILAVVLVSGVSSAQAGQAYGGTYVRRTGDAMSGALRVVQGAGTSGLDALSLRSSQWLRWEDTKGAGTQGGVRGTLLNGSRAVEVSDYVTALGVRVTPTAYGSLPGGGGGVCPAAMVGTWMFDSAGFPRFCDSASWRAVAPGGGGAAVSLYFNSKASLRFARVRAGYWPAGSLWELTCVVLSVGAGGGNAVATLIANNVAAGTTNMACAAALGSEFEFQSTTAVNADGARIGIQVDPTACTSFPEYQCNVTVRAAP